MQSILKMVILGVVQGATEFLPVSSSGHLTIMQDVLGIKENRVLLDVFLHLGTLIAIFIVFRRDLLNLLSTKRTWIPYLIIASLPAAAVGFTLNSCIERVFNSIQAVGLLLMVNSLILAAGSMAARRRREILPVGTGGAVIVGVAQSVAILPGISRAGSTVCSGLLVGWERKEAVKFSFLLAIPAIIGATGFEVLKSTSALGSGGFVGLALLGLAVSALVGWVALHLFMKAVEGGKLWVFAVYSFLLGAAVTAYKLAA